MAIIGGPHGPAVIGGTSVYLQCTGIVEDATGAKGDHAATPASSTGGSPAAGPTVGLQNRSRHDVDLAPGGDIDAAARAATRVIGPPKPANSGAIHLDGPGRRHRDRPRRGDDQKPAATAARAGSLPPASPASHVVGIGVVVIDRPRRAADTRAARSAVSPAAAVTAAASRPRTGVPRRPARVARPIADDGTVHNDTTGRVDGNSARAG